MLNVDENAVTFHALGTSISQPEAFNATNIWMWNHLGMTWNNGTSSKIFSSALSIGPVHAAGVRFCGISVIGFTLPFAHHVCVLRYINISQ